MTGHKSGLFAVILMAGLSLTGCGSFSITGQPPTSPGVQETAVAETVVAELTRLAAQASPTPPPATQTETPTPQPTATATAIPTETPIRTPTPTPIPCDWAWFERDVSVNDGSLFPPGTTFNKTWRLTNIGSCTWTPEYDVVFSEGDRMGAASVQALPDFVLPGQSIDLSVEMSAPERVGRYRGEWKLRNADGLLFGVGDFADSSFWVEIEVKEPLRERVHNFAKEYCGAKWQSGAEDDLPCPGREGSEEGFVILLFEPALENRNENELALWVHPNVEEDGWIRGIYPPFRVREGDRFKAWIGCLQDSPGCEVEFRLDYQTSEEGPIRNLGLWRERFDGQVTILDLDLTNLADDNIIFHLEVRVVRNPVRADAFWFVPAIRRIEYLD